ncbi:MAG: hypothetical protein F6J95_023775 [Leptolyngbya sp. SIO1E4]|nr:hypothetical protein [Leptolyngbya sp. SIO1E4]
MKLTSNSPINQLRQAIYERCGVLHCSKGYRSKKLRQVCHLANGLDLRRKADVVYLAERLGIVDRTVIHVDFGVQVAA